MPQAWKPLLEKHALRIEQISKSVGLVRIGEIKATAFVVATNVIALPAFAIPDEIRNVGAGASFAEKAAMLVFGDSELPNSGVSHKLIEVVSVPPPNSEELFAYVRFDGHDISLNPPLAVTSANYDGLSGRYVFIIGYPFTGNLVGSEGERLPLAGSPGVKRLMPGRIVHLQAVTAETHEIIADLRSGIGTAGAPLVDLESGTVLAMHRGATLQAEGVFASAHTPKAATVSKIVRK